MSICRHGSDSEHEDCMNCERDQEEFDLWWQRNVGPVGPLTPLKSFGETIWKAAIKHIERDMSLLD